MERLRQRIKAVPKRYLRSLQQSQLQRLQGKVWAVPSQLGTRKCPRKELSPESGKSGKSAELSPTAGSVKVCQITQQDKAANVQEVEKIRFREVLVITLEANMTDIEVDEMNVEGTERVSTVVRPSISVSKDKGKTWQKVGGKVDSGADSSVGSWQEPSPSMYRYLGSGRAEIADQSRRRSNLSSPKQRAYSLEGE